MMGTLRGEMHGLAGNSLLSAGFITYLADEKEGLRAELDAVKAHLLNQGLTEGDVPRLA